MRSMLLFLLAGLTLGLTGCGQSGPKLCEVEGTVTLDGQPLKNAQLTFIPQNVPSTMISYGRTDSDGHYRLAFTANKTGALPALHHVRIEAPDGEAALKLPRKYREEGSVTAEVKEGKNVINLELTSQ